MASEKAVELINVFSTRVANNAKYNHTDYEHIDAEYQAEDALRAYITTLETENASMRERLAGFDPKEVMPPEGVDVLAFTQHDDYQLLNWNGVCYCEAYGSDNATEPAGFYDEEIVRWWRLPDRPQSGGEQESEQ